MDLVPIVDAAQTYLATHPWACFMVGSAMGYAANNIPAMVTMSFKMAMKFPLFRAAIIANPKRAKEIIDQIETELDRNIDEAVGQEKQPEIKIVPLESRDEKKTEPPLP